jgi:hypothetical protein
MAKASSKKPGPPKCKKCHGLLEGKDVARIGGHKWHKECAETAGKKIPAEYKK